MNAAKLNDWAQVVGIFALVASLVFVGLEMRQSREIALSAAYQARADSSMSLRMSVLESDTLQSAFAKAFVESGLISIDGMTPEEAVALRGRWNGGMVYVENMHFQYLNGFISEEQWQTNRNELVGLLRWNPDWRTQLLANCANYRESFCVEIKAAAEKAAARPN
jgi:hypothetical protein